MTILLYDDHWDEIQINMYSDPSGVLRISGDCLSNGSHAAVYPNIRTQGSKINQIISNNPAITSGIPITVLDDRLDLRRRSRLVPKFTNTKMFVNGNQDDDIDLDGNLSISYFKIDSGSDDKPKTIEQKFDDLGVTQIHIDPDFFSKRGRRKLFGTNMRDELFYWTGDNSATTVIDVLTKRGSQLDILGLFEVYGHLVEDKEEANQFYKAIDTVLETSGFSPKHIAVDPSILEKVPDLEGMAEKEIDLMDYEERNSSVIISNEPKLYELEKTLVVAKSHYSAVMTYNQAAIPAMCCSIKEKFSGEGEIVYSHPSIPRRMEEIIKETQRV